MHVSLCLYIKLALLEANHRIFCPDLKYKTFVYAPLPAWSSSNSTVFIAALLFFLPPFLFDLFLISFLIEMFGRRRSFVEASPPDPNSIIKDTRYSSALSKTGGATSSLARSRSSTGAWPYSAHGDSGEWEPSHRERFAGVRSSLSTRPLSRKSAHQHTSPLMSLKSDIYSKNAGDYASSPSTSSTPRLDLRTDFSRVAGAPERPTVCDLHSSALVFYVPYKALP